MKTIKISTLVSSLHDKQSFRLENNNFLKEISSELSIPFVCSSLDDYDCDLKLIFIESGGSEILFKNSFNKLKEPYYFLTSGDNNSLAATLEIVTYLNNLGKKAEILHGPISYIAKTIETLLDK